MEQEVREYLSERHARLILDSYERLLGKPLLEIGPDEKIAIQLFEAPFVVLSHGTQSDPILNYGNRAALQLWEMDHESFIRMASRQTAEPLIQTDRQRFLQAVNEKGYMDGYSGIRISSSGRRFRIENTVVWNLTDETGEYRGQAATFANHVFV